MATAEPEHSLCYLGTALMPSMYPKPMPVPTTEPEHEASSVSKPKVATQADQVCVPTSTYEPLGNREEGDSIPLLNLPNLKTSSPLVLPSPKPSSPLVLPSLKTSSLLVLLSSMPSWLLVLPILKTASLCIIHQPCLPLSPPLHRLIRPSAHLRWCPSVPVLLFWLFSLWIRRGLLVLQLSQCVSAPVFHLRPPGLLLQLGPSGSLCSTMSPPCFIIPPAPP